MKIEKRKHNARSVFFWLFILINVIGYASLILSFLEVINPFPIPFLSFIVGQGINILIVIFCLVSLIFVLIVKKWRLKAKSVLILLGLALILTIPTLLNIKTLGAPPISDISTSFNSQLVFHSKEAAYHPKPIVKQNFKFQQMHYPHIMPLKSDLSEKEAYKRSLTIFKQLNWPVTYQNGTNIIQVVKTSKIWKFKDDIIIVITKQPNGVIINIRSASRVGDGDFGANAAQILKFQTLFQHTDHPL